MIRRPPRSTLFPYTTLFRSQQPGNLAVEPVMQLPGLGVAGELSQEILIAGSLAAVGVLLVEAFTSQRDVLGVGVNRFASDLWAQRGDQAAGAEHVRESVIAGVVQLEDRKSTRLNSSH